MEWSAIIAQSIWKRKLTQRQFQLKRKSAILIQRNWRIHLKRAAAKQEIIRKQEVTRLENLAAIKIQRTFRGYLARQIIIPKLKQELKDRQELLLASAIQDLDTRGSPQNDKNQMLHDEGMDEWLKTVKCDDFDQELESYLSSESLIHFPKANIKSKYVKSKNTEGVRLINSSLGTRIIREREDLLTRLVQQLPMLEHEPLPPRNPYDPVQVLLLSRGKLQSAQIGQASFDIPSDTTKIIPDISAEPQTQVIQKEESPKDQQPQEPFQPTIEQEMNTITSLYNSLLESGILNAKPNKPVKQKTETENEMIKKKYSEYVVPSETESIDEKQDPKEEPKEECDIIYAWDAKNQSPSSRKKLFKIRKEAQLKTASVPVQSISLLEETELPRKPYIIPLVNNYFLQKMYGVKTTKQTLNPNSKLPGIRKGY